MRYRVVHGTLMASCARIRDKTVSETGFAYLRRRLRRAHPPSRIDRGSEGIALDLEIDLRHVQFVGHVDGLAIQALSAHHPPGRTAVEVPGVFKMTRERHRTVE